MNLERIYVNGYLILNKISELSKQYVCINIEEDSQKINNGNFVMAMLPKNVEQLKGTRPFFIKTETEIFSTLEKIGYRLTYDLSIQCGALVKFNLRKYTVLGVVVNNYAQWNIPTPFLFDTFDLVADYKALFNSRFSDEEINSKINDNFQAGKYDNQMTIPLIDLNEKSNEIEIVEETPSVEEVKLLEKKFSYKNSLVLTAKKDVFFDTIIKENSVEIDKIRAENRPLYESMQDMLIAVNNSINNKISGTKEVKTVPVVVAEKEVETPKEVSAEDDLSFLNDIDGVLDLSFLDDIDNLV